MGQYFCQRLLEQLGALYIKNFLVAWRNRRATILRLVAPFFFLLLALLIDKALQANDANSTYFSDVKRPEADAITPIPQCSQDVFIGTSKPCIELVYSPNNTLSQSIMAAVVTNNAIPIQPAMGFASRSAAQDFLLANPDYAIAAVHFVFDNDTSPTAQLQGFVIQTNTTIKAFKNNVQDPNTFVQLPLQSAVHREIARYNLAQNPATASLATNLGWYVGLKVFAHPTISTVSVLGNVLGPFVFAACMFSFVTQIGALVMEKEAGLRQALTTMGMRDSSYWMSWVGWEITLAFISANLIACFGLLLQFDLFLDNNYGLLFFLFFLFLLSMSALGQAFSTLLSRTQTAVYLGFIIFIVGWIMQTVVIFGVPYTPDYWTSSTVNTVITVIFSAFPWNLLMKGFQDLGRSVANGQTLGIQWDERNSYCQNIESLDAQNAWAQANGYNPQTQYVDFSCVFPLGEVFSVMAILWAGYLLLAIYLDNVVVGKRGVLYFLKPSYWRPSTLSPTAALTHVLREDSLGSDDSVARDEDVAAEEARVRTLLNHRTGHTSKEGELAAAVDVRNAIEVFGLKKKFGGSRGCCGHSLVCPNVCDGCSCKAVDAFWPIKGSWLAIEQDQLFCLLGPNGAGKTTTINCLTGVLQPTYGDALIYGQSIRSTGGMDKIRSLMGVCPQFDVLWPELTGREHLVLYGRIKGCGWKGAVTEAESLLDKVKLTYAAGQRSGAYSGGMKRRLSVAIALLGDPKVVYLDEPTTGMDPISRRYVWDIIQEAKVGRAIVLTTHSMEEADILGDRIAIMALGRLRCIGSSLRLKQRFGSGYQVAVSVQPGTGVTVDPATLDARRAAVTQLFESQLGVTPADQGRSYTTYLVPRERESDLVPFLSSLESRSAELGITDIQLSLTSLEEVFLKIARSAALEAAQAGNTGPRKRNLPFWRTVGKVSLIGLTIPVSIFGVCYWKRWIMGKDKDHRPTVHLPDGTELPVEPGQEHVQDPATGAYYEVVWGVDDSGNLVVQDVKPTTSPPAGLLLTDGSANGIGNRTGSHVNGTAGGVLCTAMDGKARVPLPGNVLLEVAVGDSYVLNPHDGVSYLITWAHDATGQHVITGCTPAPPPPGTVPSPPLRPGSAGGAVPPVAGHGTANNGHNGLPVANPAAGATPGTYTPPRGSQR